MLDLLCGRGLDDGVELIKVVVCALLEEKDWLGRLCCEEDGVTIGGAEDVDSDDRVVLPP